MTKLTIEIPEKVEKTLSDLVEQLGGKVIAVNTIMKVFYVIRPDEDPSGFNVQAESRKEAIQIATESYGYCHGTVAREINGNIPGILVSREALLPFEESLLPNYKQEINDNT